MKLTNPMALIRVVVLAASTGLFLAGPAPAQTAGRSPNNNGTAAAPANNPNNGAAANTGEPGVPNNGAAAPNNGAYGNTGSANRTDNGYTGGGGGGGWGLWGLVGLLGLFGFLRGGSRTTTATNDYPMR